MQNFEYIIERKVKGTRTFYFPTKNGKRFTKTNFARKYDAKGLVKNLINQYGVEKLNEYFNN
jgi:hypothetical protein